MLMLTSDQWIKHIRDRNLRWAQTGGRKTQPGYGVVPSESAGIQYVWDENGELQAIRVPTMRAHPFYTLDPESLRSRESVEIRRPTAPQWGQAWARIFDPSRREELETSPYLPKELMGSPPPEMQWWSEAWKAVASPEEGEPRRIIDPSVVDPSRMPTMEVHGRVGWTNREYAAANVALIEMMELMRGVSVEARNIDEDPSSLGRIQEMGETYEELRRSLIYPIQQMIDGMIRSLAGQTGRPVEELESLIDPWPVISHAMVKLFGTHYNARVKIKSKREGEPAMVTDPLTYLWHIIAADINGLVQEHLLRVQQTSSTNQMTEEQGDAAEALLQNSNDLVQAFRESPTETAALDATAQQREQIVENVKRAYPGLTEKLNQGFAAFLTSGAVGLVSPMMTEGMLRNLFNPDGTPIFDVGSTRVIPDSWCPNCGRVRDVKNGENQPALIKDGERYRCQFCNIPIGSDVGRPREFVPGAGGGSEGAQFVPQEYGMAEPTLRQVESSINTPLLAYLEMERQNKEKWTNAERLGIFYLMQGLPLVRIQKGQGIAPAKSHARRFFAVTMPQSGKIVAYPVAYRTKLSEQSAQSMHEQQMFIGGLGIGDLVRGREWQSAPVGHSFEMGGPLPPESTEYNPLGTITNPAEIGRAMATQMARDVAPNDIEAILPGEEMRGKVLRQTQSPEERKKKSTVEQRKQFQDYTSTLVANAMFYLGPTIPMSMGRVDPETNTPIPLTSDQILSDFEPTIRNGAYQIAAAYGYDEEKVYDDLADMISYVDQVSKTPGSAIRPEWLSDRMVSYIFSNLGGPMAMSEEEMAAALVDAFREPSYEVGSSDYKKDERKLMAEASKAIEKSVAISEHGQKIEETAGKIRERQFDLGWTIVGEAGDLRAARGQEDLATLLAKNVSGLKRPFGYAERTIEPVVKRQIETEAEKLRQDLAASVVGMFGFGNDYNGYQGVISGGTVDESNTGFTVDLSVEVPEDLYRNFFDAEEAPTRVSVDLPDGMYQMFVGEIAVPVSKAGNDWSVVDPKFTGSSSKIPRGFSAGPGTPIMIDESIIERTGMPGGGSKLSYRTSSDFSPEAIAERWGISPDQVKSLQATTLSQGVASMFSRPTYDPVALTKNVMAGLLPSVLSRLFMETANRRFIENMSKETGRITVEDRTFQDPIGRASEFVLDVGNAARRGLDRGEVQAIAAKYPEVPWQYTMMVANEVLSGSGPSFRTYLIASNYADRLKPLAEPFEMTASTIPSSMKRFAVRRFSMFEGMLR